VRMGSARLQSLDTLKDVKAAVMEFAEAVNRTLTGVDADVGRVGQWLNQDRPAHWKARVRRCEDEVAKAQADIMRKKLIAAPEPASVVEEQKALDAAKRRLAHAQRKLDNVRKWAPVWDREAMLYKTACRGLTEAVHRDMPAAAARLDHLMASLEEYMRVAVPRTEGEAAPPPGLGDDAGEEPPGAEGGER
jgi:hypothetical protein